MLKFQIVTKDDLKEAAKIERRRRLEEERKKRIFNAKNRLFGQDYEFLGLQIVEKQKKEHIEAEKERKYLEENIRRAGIIRFKEKELEEERLNYQSKINSFRIQKQRKEDTREFDLNDPNFLRNSKPARIADDDPRLGVSSAQIFRGEDLMKEDRLKIQKQQQRAWFEQQIKERKQAEDDRVKAEKTFQKATQACDKRILQLADIDRNNRIQLLNATREFNQKLAMEQENKRRLQKKHEEEDNLAEIYNMLTSDMLTENPDVANSRLGLNKKIAYLYRGMSPEELEKLKREQHNQVELQKKKQNEEALIDKLWIQQDLNFTRSVMLKNLETQKKLNDQKQEMNNENERLAVEQKARQEYIDKVLYTNRATDDFFDQFNKTSR